MLNGYIVFNLYNSDATRNQGKAWYVPAADFIYRHLYLNMTYSRRITHVLPVGMYDHKTHIFDGCTHNLAHTEPDNLLKWSKVKEAPLGEVIN